MEFQHMSVSNRLQTFMKLLETEKLLPLKQNDASGAESYLESP